MKIISEKKTGKTYKLIMKNEYEVRGRDLKNPEIIKTFKPEEVEVKFISKEIKLGS